MGVVADFWRPQRPQRPHRPRDREKLLSMLIASSLWSLWSQGLEEKPETEETEETTETKRPRDNETLISCQSGVVVVHCKRKHHRIVHSSTAYGVLFRDGSKMTTYYKKLFSCLFCFNTLCCVRHTEKTLTGYELAGGLADAVCLVLDAHESHLEVADELRLTLCE